jgi:hypothetical protein
MGTVYLGHSPGGRRVAVKVIHRAFADDPEFRARFAREIAAASRVGGFHTALVVDADTDGPVPWLATAYVPGPSLAEAVRENGPLAPGPVWALAAALAEGLSAIHEAGIIHRDLKPSNVLLASDGARIIDFGIAQGSSLTSITRSGAVIGTPAYMSPEQIRGLPLTPASDVFSLGSVLAFAATGTEPFGSGDPAAVMFRLAYEAPDLSAVPGKLRPLIERFMAKDPAERPATSQILAEVADLKPPDWPSQMVSPAGDGAGSTGTFTSLRPTPPASSLDWSVAAVGPADPPAGRGGPRTVFRWLGWALVALAAILRRFFVRVKERASVRRTPRVPVPAGPRGGSTGGSRLWRMMFPGHSAESPRRDAPNTPAELGGPPGSGGPPLPPVPVGGPDPEEPERGTVGPTADELAVLNAITDRSGFAIALREVRVRAGLTSKQVADATRLPVGTVSGYFTGRSLPSDPGRLRAILAACGVAQASMAHWEAALLRVREASRSGRRDSAVPPPSPAGWVGDFPASVLSLSAEAPASAIDLFGRSGVSPEAASGLAEALKSKHREVMLADLEARQEDERRAAENAQRMMGLRHDTERILVEAGIYPYRMQGAAVSAVLANLAPALGEMGLPVSFTAAHPSIPQQPAGSAPPFSVELHQQFITASDANIVQGRHGAVNNTGIDARQIIALIERHGGSDIQPLRAAVQDLENTGSSPAKRSAAKNKILGFVGLLADNGKEVLANVIVKYLAALSGAPS